MSRRYFIRRMAAIGGVLAAGAAGYGIYEASSGGPDTNTHAAGSTKRRPSGSSNHCQCDHDEAGRRSHHPHIAGHHRRER